MQYYSKYVLFYKLSLLHLMLSIDIFNYGLRQRMQTIVLQAAAGPQRAFMKI